jgi:murein DD-endopeptidase MepM/ murein hydrolase activator NlpD
VLVCHQDGYATLYGHLSAVSVRAGDQVSQGEVIGLSAQHLVLKAPVR